MSAQAIMRATAEEPTSPPSRPPVVLQVLPALVTGGVERGAVDIAAALVQAGWVSLVASAGGPMVREVERAGATHVTLPLDSKNPLVVRRNVGRLTELIAARQVDIVHARSRAPAWSAYFAARRMRKPFVTTFHGVYNAGNRLKRLYNSVMVKGARTIAISEFIGRHVIEDYGVPPGTVRVIPRGVDLDVFDPARVSPERVIRLARQWRLPDGVPVVMLPGRLTRWKGQTLLIEAMARLGRRDAVCVLVGSDQGRQSYRAELEALVKKRGIEGCFRIVDHCRDMPAAYMLADVVVSASTDPEAFGRVVAEAQAMGRPVVAPDHGGAREIVLPGETGWLVAPGDPAALAAALEEGLNLDLEQRVVLAERAAANVRAAFARPAMCAATIEVYAEILAEYAGSRG